MKKVITLLMLSFLLIGYGVSTPSSSGEDKENVVSLYTFKGEEDFISVSNEEFLNAYITNKKRDYDFAKITLSKSS